MPSSSSGRRQRSSSSWNRSSAGFGSHTSRRARHVWTASYRSGETRHPNAENRSEEHTSELQSPCNLVCRLLLEKKKKRKQLNTPDYITNIRNSQHVRI